MFVNLAFKLREDTALRRVLLYEVNRHLDSIGNTLLHCPVNQINASAYYYKAGKKLVNWFHWLYGF